MKNFLLAAVATITLASPIHAQEALDKPTPTSVVENSLSEEWVAIDPADLLVMTLAPDAQGNSRELVIQLMPAPFSQGWVKNIKTLAAAHWWDGLSIYRSVDNWVVQWGDGEEEGVTPKPLPEGLNVVPESEYVTSLESIREMPQPRPTTPLVPSAQDRIQEFYAQFSQEQISDVGRISVDPTKSDKFPEGWHERDSYQPWVEFVDGWPIASDDSNEAGHSFWPTHCYGSIGVARGLSPDTGTGAELYAVIGHAPRQLDRNIAVVGRVIEGMQHLSILQRGTGDFGVYETKAEHTPIMSVRLGNDIGELPPPRFEYLYNRSASFQKLVAVSANRNDAFYKDSAGGIDICNIKVPIRRVEKE